MACRTKRLNVSSYIHWFYYPEAKYNFYRVGFYNNIFGSKKMSIYVEIGFKHNETIDVRKSIKKVLRQ